MVVVGAAAAAAAATSQTDAPTYLSDATRPGEWQGPPPLVLPYLHRMNAKVNNVPLGLLGGLRRVTALFQWSKEVSDRLAFSELLSNNTEFNAPMEVAVLPLGLRAAAL